MSTSDYHVIDDFELFIKYLLECIKEKDERLEELERAHRIALEKCPAKACGGCCWQIG